jgi:hypothetical protein
MKREKTQKAVGRRQSAEGGKRESVKREKTQKAVGRRQRAEGRRAGERET